MASKLTPGSFVAQMVGEFCIPVVLGKAKGSAPIEGTWLEPEERAKFGLKAPGNSMRYNLGDATVYMDLSGNCSQIWFEHPDASRALKLVEEAVKKAAPKMKQTHDVPRDKPGLRSRIFEGEFDRGIIIQVEVAYPDPKGGGPRETANRFMVRTYGLLKKGAPNPYEGQGMPPSSPQKKN